MSTKKSNSIWDRQVNMNWKVILFLLTVIFSLVGYGYRSLEANINDKVSATAYTEFKDMAKRDLGGIVQDIKYLRDRTEEVNSNITKINAQIEVLTELIRDHRDADRPRR